MKMAMYDLDQRIQEGIQDVYFEVGYLSSLVEQIHDRLKTADSPVMVEEARRASVEMIEAYLDAKSKSKPSVEMIEAYLDAKSKSKQ